MSLSVGRGNGRGGCRIPRPGSSWRANHAREVAMTAAATRRTILAGGTMLLGGRAAAQQVTTLKLYSLGWEIDAAMLASEVPRRTGGRYQIEQFNGFDALEAALGKERAAGGERTLLEGVRNGDLDLVVCSAYLLSDYVPEANAFFVP